MADRFTEASSSVWPPERKVTPKSDNSYSLWNKGETYSSIYMYVRSGKYDWVEWRWKSIENHEIWLNITVTSQAYWWPFVVYSVQQKKQKFSALMSVIWVISYWPGTAQGTVLCRVVTVALAMSAAVYLVVQLWPAVTMLGFSRVPSR